jgi:hypothetical protein
MSCRSDPISDSARVIYRCAGDSWFVLGQRNMSHLELPRQELHCYFIPVRGSNE